MSDIVTDAKIYDVTPERRFMGPLLDDDYGFTRGASSGVRITTQNALQSSTVVLACTRVLAETVASLSLHLYKRLPNGGRERAPGWLDRLLSQSPNSYQTSFEWLETCMTHLCLYGACYSEIVPGPAGTIAELLPLNPSRMKGEKIENGRLRFTYTEPNGAKTIYTQDQLFRVVWMSLDGINGSVPVELGKEAIALARACELHGARWFGNGARPGVVLETDANLAPEAAERLRENWERMHRGPDRSERTAVLTGGLKAHELDGSKSNTDSQFLETRKWQSIELCRIWRVPPHMIQDLTGATFSNIEQQSLDFLQYSIMPWLRRFEKAFARDLIPDPDTHFALFDTRVLMRGDAASRIAYYSQGLDRGIFSINDVRAAEGMNPVEGGDTHFMPLNMTTLDVMNMPVAAKPPEVATVLDRLASGNITPEAAKILLAAQNPVLSTEAAAKIVEGSNTAAQPDRPQVMAMLQVINDVAGGILSEEGAIAVMAAAFPQLDSAQVKAIVDGVNAGTKPEPQATEPQPAPAAEVAPAADSDAEPTTPATPEVSLQAMALNGAQVTALLEVIAQIGAGTITADAAQAIITSAFPTIAESVAQQMVAGANKPAEPLPAVEPAPPVAEPPAGPPAPDAVESPAPVTGKPKRKRR